MFSGLMRNGLQLNHHLGHLVHLNRVPIKEESIKCIDSERVLEGKQWRRVKDLVYAKIQKAYLHAKCVVHNHGNTVVYTVKAWHVVREVRFEYRSSKNFHGESMFFARNIYYH